MEKWHLFWVAGEGAVSDLDTEEFETYAEADGRIRSLREEHGASLSYKLIHGTSVEIHGL